MALALQRLASARANLATLEEAAQTPAVKLAQSDPGDLARIEETEAEIAKLRHKASGRFGGGAARERIEELELSQRLVLERIGVSSYADFRAVLDAPESSTAAIDKDVLAFARREFENAEQAFLEVAALVIPENEAEEPVDDGEGAEVIDLKVKPQAAS